MWSVPGVRAEGVRRLCKYRARREPDKRDKGAYGAVYAAANTRSTLLPITAKSGKVLNRGKERRPGLRVRPRVVNIESACWNKGHSLIFAEG